MMPQRHSGLIRRGPLASRLPILSVVVVALLAACGPVYKDTYRRVNHDAGSLPLHLRSHDPNTSLAIVGTVVPDVNYPELQFVDISMMLISASGETWVNQTIWNSPIDTGHVTVNTNEGVEVRTRHYEIRPLAFYIVADVPDGFTVNTIRFYHQRAFGKWGVDYQVVDLQATLFFDTGAGGTTPFVKMKRGGTYDLGNVVYKGVISDRELLATDGDPMAGGISRNQRGLKVSKNPLASIDSDGDGVFDAMDLDDDGDGTPDLAEVGAAIYDPNLPNKPTPSPSPTPVPSATPGTTPTPSPSVAASSTPSPAPLDGNPTEPPKGASGSEDTDEPTEGGGHGGHD